MASHDIVRGQYSDVPVEEFRDRLQRMQAAMKERGFDALLLTQLVNVWYITGYKTWLRISNHRPFAALVPADGDPVLMLPPMEEITGHKFSWVDDIRAWPAEGYVQQYADVLREKGLTSATIGAELGPDTRIGMPVMDWTKLTAELPDNRWLDCTDLIWDVRSIKSPLEVERIEKACEATDASIVKAWESLQPGMTERDVARIIGRTMLDHGADIPAFLVVRSGPGGADMFNQVATDRVLEEGDLVGLDIGCMYGEYHSDLIRVGCVGKPTEAQIAAQAVAVEANTAVREAVRPGMTIDELDAVRRQVIGDSDYRPAWEGIGHMIGASVHELPRVGPGETTVLEPGMVFTIEPGILSETGWLHCVEDIVVVTEDGSRTLSHAPRHIGLESY